MNGTIEAVRAALDAGATTSRRLVEACLERATAADGEGSRTFVRLFAEQALADAEAIDLRRRAGLWTGPLGGIPISIKDLFDVRGMPTTAGSVALADSAPAAFDAVAVTRLRAAGAVIFGRTNMTEFAFSGLGLNPHYGTPAGPFDRAARRIPGGSSSGAAVSVSDGIAAVSTNPVFKPASFDRGIRTEKSLRRCTIKLRPTSGVGNDSSASRVDSMQLPAKTTAHCGGTRRLLTTACKPAVPQRRKESASD